MQRIGHLIRICGLSTGRFFKHPGIHTHHAASPVNINFVTRFNSSRDELLTTLQTENKTDDPWKSISEKLLKALDGRRVAELRSVFTIPRSERSESNLDFRLRNLSLLIALRERLNPRKCVFQATEVEQEELDFLAAQDIAWQSVHDLAQQKPLAGELDVFYVSDGHCGLANDLLVHRWEELGTTRLILLDGHVTQYDNPELQALKVFCENSQGSKMPPRVLFPARLLFHTRHDKRMGWVIMKNFQQQDSVPAMEAKKEYVHTLLPFYEDSSKHPKRLVQMTELSHIAANVRKIQDHLAENGFLTEVVGNLTKILDGRTIKRIRLVGIGQFAYNLDCASELLRCLYQLSLALHLRSHFRVLEVTSQEPTTTQFEKEYLNSIGVEVLDPTQMKQVEAGLERDEATLFIMFYSYQHLHNNIFWANRKQMRKVIVVGNDNFAHQNCKDNCERSVELIRRIQNEYTALVSFFKKCVNKPLISPPYAEHFQLSEAFINQGILSYPEDSLSEVDDEEEPVSRTSEERNSLILNNLPPCTCGTI